MRIPYVSASRLKVASQCTLRYEHQYQPSDPRVGDLRAAAEQNKVGAHLGTACHNALERWRALDRWPEFQELEDLIDFYRDEVNKLPKTLPFNKVEEGELLLTKWFHKRGIIPDDVEIIGVEMTMGTAQEPYIIKGLPVYGMMDLVLRHEDGTIEIVDYKSNMMPYTDDEVEKDVQAGIYQMVAWDMFPDAPAIVMTFDFLRFGEKTTEWSKEKLELFHSWVMGQYMKVKALTAGEPEIGEGCRWCEFWTICPAAKSLLDIDAWASVIGGDPTDPDSVYSELAKVKAVSSLIERRKAALTRDIKTLVANRGGVVETNDLIVSLEDKTRTTYDAEKLRRVIGDTALAAVAKPQKGLVDRLLSQVDDKQKRDEILACQSETTFQQLKYSERLPYMEEEGNE